MMTIKNPPPQVLFCVFGLRWGGGGALAKQVAQLVIPVVQVEGNLFKYGYFGWTVPLLVADGRCFFIVGLRTCKKANAMLQDFWVRQESTIVIPFIDKF